MPMGLDVCAVEGRRWRLLSPKDLSSGARNEFQALGWGEVRDSGTKKSEFSSCGKLGKFDQRHAGVLADKSVRKGEIVLEPVWSQIISDQFGSSKFIRE